MRDRRKSRVEEGNETEQPVTKSCGTVPPTLLEEQWRPEENRADRRRRLRAVHSLTRSRSAALSLDSSVSRSPRSLGATHRQGCEVGAFTVTVTSSGFRSIPS